VGILRIKGNIKTGKLRGKRIRGDVILNIVRGAEYQGLFKGHIYIRRAKSHESIFGGDIAFENN